MGISEAGESESLLARESDSEAPAWLAKHSPAEALPSVLISAISGLKNLKLWKRLMAMFAK
jgi:hypothetical protein